MYQIVKELPQLRHIACTKLNSFDIINARNIFGVCGVMRSMLYHGCTPLSYYTVFTKFSSN